MPSSSGVVVTSTPATGEVTCSECGPVVDSEALAGDEPVLASFRRGHLDLHIEYDTPDHLATLDPSQSEMSPLGGQGGLWRTVDRWDYEGGGYNG